MNQHEHPHHKHHDRKYPGMHKDWRTWLVVGLMLAAMLMYVLSNDEADQPGGEMAPAVPAAE